MPEEKKVRFSGTDEELRELLAGAARAFGGWAGSDRRGGHRLVFGHFLSLNPNTLRWWAEVRREGVDLFLRARTLGWPWTRAKHERVAEFRMGQIADYLEVKLRGGGQVAKFGEMSSRLPFVTAGHTVADVTMAWTWLLLSCLACGTLTWLACTLAALFVIDPLVASLTERSAQVSALGGVALPTTAELNRIELPFRLACAALLAFPIAFFLGSLYGLLQLLGEFWTPVSRAVWLVPAFQLVLLLIALVPVIAVPTAIAMSLLIPITAHVGYSLVWGRKKEKRRPLAGAPRRGLLPITALLLGGMLAAALLPAPRSGEKLTAGLAEFRDRQLLTNRAGRGLARFYYRHTLYAAEPLKEAYDPAPRGYDRQVRTAHIAGSAPRLEEKLRSFGFVVDPDRTRAQRLCDVIVIAGAEVPPDSDARAVAIAPEATDDQIRQALAKSARGSFRGQGLREITQLGWWAVFYLGPFALFALPALVLLPGISTVFRKLAPKKALAVLGVAGAASVGGILWVARGESGTLDATKAIRAVDPQVPNSATALLPHLESGHPGVRFEATYRIYWCIHSPANRPRELLEPMVKALRDPDLRVRLWACGALGRYGDAAAIPELIRSMDDPEIFVRYRAAGALGDLADELRAQLQTARRREAEEEASMKSAASREDADRHAANARELRERAAEFTRGLARLRETAVERLLRMTREDDWYCGTYALAALRRIDPGKY